jgi:serine/threonine protein kinase
VDTGTESDRWRNAQEILADALELAPAARAAFVRDQAHGDAALIAEVESLLDGADSTVTLPIDRPALGRPHAQPPEFTAGHNLGHYQIVETLGKGGMGIVYLAKDVRLDRLAALKLLAAPLDAPADRRNFVREARAASALNHPNIITIYEYATVSGLDFIAMEYVRGTTLAERLKNNPPPLMGLLEIARQTAVALSRAHAARIVHRDLKPANIMISDEGAVKVLDFGIARKSSPIPGEMSSGGKMIAGTAAYMAPEVALGETAGAQADIFSLGVILYEMAAGQRPFRGKDAPETLKQVMYHHPPRVETINPKAPAALGDLIEKCLQKEMTARMGSMQEVADALARITDQKINPGRRWLLAFASAAAAGLLTYAVSGWMNGPAEPPLSYTLEAQKSGEALPYVASVSEVFQAGGKFRLRLHAAAPGYFYVVTETPKDIGVVFPLSGTPPQPVSATVTGWFVFDENPGTERVWLIWSARPLPMLAAHSAASPARVDQLRELLTRLPAGDSGLAGTLLQLQHK